MLSMPLGWIEGRAWDLESEVAAPIDSFNLSAQQKCSRLEVSGSNVTSLNVLDHLLLNGGLKFIRTILSYQP